MVDDMFELTIDAAFPPKQPIISNKNNVFISFFFFVLEANNDFELLYCECGSVHCPNGKNARTKISLENLYPFP